jgi:hypothetical protein
MSIVFVLRLSHVESVLRFALHCIFSIALESSGRAIPKCGGAPHSRAKADTRQQSSRYRNRPAWHVQSAFVVDTEGHKKSQQEANETEAEKERRNYEERWTLYYPGAAAIGTIALVIVGALAAFFANRTLKAIERQADLMEQQATEAREVAAQATSIARASADAATISAEAARESSAIAKQSLQTTQRAFLTFVRWQTMPFFSQPNNQGDVLHIRIMFEYENVGKPQPFRLRLFTAL